MSAVAGILEGGMPSAPPDSGLSRLRSVLTVIRAVLAILLMGAWPLSAQITSIRGLSFGTVWPGYSKSIDVTSATSAHWSYYTVLAISRNVSFTLPTALTRVGGGSLPISFCNTCARYRLNSSDVTGATPFNPNTGSYGLSISLLSTMYFWLGGTVTPSLSQPKGTYTGTIVITLAIL